MSNQVQVTPPVTSELLPQTRDAIDRFMTRRSRLQICQGVALGLVVLLIAMIIVALVDHFWRPSDWGRSVLSLVGYGLAGWVAWKKGVSPARNQDVHTAAQSMEVAAQNIESPQHEEQNQLHEKLVAAVELEDPRHANGSVDLRLRLQKGVAQTVSQLDVASLLPWRLIRRSLLAAVGVIAILGLTSMISALQMPRRLARAFFPIAPIERASLTRIDILQPNPASRSVAEGDLVAVVAKIENLHGGDVVLQYRDEDGVEGELRMSLREHHAVNVQVHQQPLQYRILAGDAETLWETLTPKPRPRGIAFEKRYVYPSYTKMPSLTETSEDGDLQAWMGTRAELTVTFDQPVRNAELLFEDAKSGTPMTAVEGRDDQFQIVIPMKMSVSYRLDAVGITSGLSNPFSPRYTIDPVADRSPQAQWNDSIAKRMIVSPASVLSLNGLVRDDLPMDEALVQTVLQGDELHELAVNLASPVPEGSVDRSWDLLDWDDDGQANDPLPAGSVLRTRLIAVDRAGNRGESAWIEVLVAGQDFDANRNEYLFQQQAMTRQAVTWFSSLGKLAETLRGLSDQAHESRGEIASLESIEFDQELGQLAKGWEEIRGTAGEVDVDSLTIEKVIEKSRDSAEVDRWMLIDQLGNQSVAVLRNDIAAWQLVAEAPKQAVDRDVRTTVVSQLRNRSGEIQRIAETAREFCQNLLAIDLAAALARDIWAIEEQTHFLTVSSSSIPIQRLPGQAELLIARMQEVSELAGKLEADLPEKVVRHQERLHRYIDEVVNRIEDESKKLLLDRNVDVRENFEVQIQRVHDEVQYQRISSLLPSDTYNRIASGLKAIGQSQWTLPRSIVDLKEASHELGSAQDRLRGTEKGGDLERFSNAKVEIRLRQLVYQQTHQDTVSWLRRVEDQSRARFDTNVRENADLKLIADVLDEIAADGFPELDGQSSHQVADTVRTASSVLLHGGRLARSASQLQDIENRERYGRVLIDQAIRQGLRLEHFQITSEKSLGEVPRWSYERADEIGIDKQARQDVFSELQATRWNRDYQTASERLTRRRWDKGEFLSAAAPLQALVSKYQTAQPLIDMARDEARQTLQSFLPTVMELASAAADEAEAQAEANRSDKQTVQEAKEEREELQEKVDRLAEALVDQANNADYSDEKQTELARDADAAVSQIKQQMKEVSKAIEESNLSAASDELDQLAETLTTTAEHFQAAAENQDMTATRERLRETLESFDGETPEALADALRSATATADATKMEPKELLKRLEESLQRNQPMQEELQSIAKQTADDAEKAIAAAAEKEQSLARELEKSDPDFLEEKRAIRDQLRSLTTQTRYLEQSWLASAEAGAAGSNEPESKKEMQETRLKMQATRERLREAAQRADQVQNDQALLNELQSATTNLQQALKSSAQQADQVQMQAEESQDLPAHMRDGKPDDSQRVSAAKRLQAHLYRVQNEWAKSLAQEARAWKSARDAAGRRVQQAQNQIRNAKRQVDQAEKQVDKNPGQDWATNGLEKSREQLAAAERAANAAQETREKASQQFKQSEKLAAESKLRPFRELKSPNPTAELVAQSAKVASIELQRLAKQAAELSQQAAIDDELTPAVGAAEQLRQQQEQTMQAVRDAAADLERAARHEERLGQPDVATKFDEAARQISQTLEDPMKKAADQLAAQASQGDEASSDEANGDEATGENPSGNDSSGEEPATQNLAKEAGAQLQNSARQLQQHRQMLSELSAAMQAASAEQNQTTSTPPGQLPTSDPAASEPTRDEKLARTLDELDRALNQPEPTGAQADQSGQANQEGQPSENGRPDENGQPTPDGQPNPDGQPAGEGQPNGEGQSQAGTPGQSQQAQSGQSAPTLAEAAQQAIRDLAAQRQQQLQSLASSGDPSSEGQPGEASGENSQGDAPPGDPSSDPSQDGKPGDESGEGSNMPEGGWVDVMAEKRVDGDWATLRKQKTGDVIQAKKSQVPMSYRNAIQAYFEVIASEASRSRNSSKVNP